MLFSGRATEKYYSSRIAILRILSDPQSPKIAILASRMTETVNCEAEEFTKNDLSSPEDSIFEMVVRKDGQRIQITAVEKLLLKKNYIALLNKIYENKPVG
jgi:chemotaxis signal transduction protein